MKDSIGMQYRAINRFRSRVVGSFGLVIAATAGGALTACGGDSTPAPIVVGTLTISPAVPTVAIGRTVKLSAEVKSTGGQVLTDRQVKWTSGSPSIAGVTDSGVVTGVSLGSALITATSEGKTATVSIKITPDPCDIDAAVPIAANAVVNGSLANTDCDFEDGTFIDAYNFVLPAATNVDVLLKSTAFNALLYVFRLEVTDSVTLLGYDNDSGGGTDARLSGLLTAGNYYILANSFNLNGLGAYSLLLTAPFTGLNAGSSLFSTPSNTAVSVRRLNATEARTFRRLMRRH
ncbi:MAG: Ig-like domain-containing protein [Gemmatimonadaceae bacterium]